MLLFGLLQLDCFSILLLKFLRLFKIEANTFHSETIGISIMNTKMYNHLLK